MTEWLKVHDWKSCGRRKLPRGFESHPLRLTSPDPVEIAALTLATAGAACSDVAAFYGVRLGLNVGEPETGRVDVQLGKARLEFSAAGGEPYHHFALLLPGDRFEAAYTWIAERVDLLPGRDGSSVFEFQGWPAKASYFLDPAGNIVELIAHPGIAEAGLGDAPFEAREIVGISEAGVVATDPASAARALSACGIDRWDGEPAAGIAFFGRRAHTVVLSAPNRSWMPTRRPAVPHPLTITLSSSGCETVIEGDGAGTVRAASRARRE